MKCIETDMFLFIIKCRDSFISHQNFIVAVNIRDFNQKADAPVIARCGKERNICRPIVGRNMAVNKVLQRIGMILH
jgi:hypothetical protein